MREYFRRYLVEFIGTFFLVFTVGCTIMLGGEGVIAAIAIGFSLMIMVYAGGQISGGHYNPAVSLAAAMRGALAYSQLLPYMISQILGAVIAALLVNRFAHDTITYQACHFGVVPLIIGEFLFTFALCYVVLMTATSTKVAGNSFYGLAIGSTVTVGIFAVGGLLCYGAFNPAVALSLGMFSIACWSSVIITIITNLAAGACAALVYKYIAPDTIEISF